LPKIKTSVANSIRNYFKTALNKTGDYANALKQNNDPYRAFIKDFNWGSTRYSALYGLMFWKMQLYDLEPTNNAFYLSASEEYLHYLHGLNPLQQVFLTNMYAYGAEKSANEMYHTWFCNGSAAWDRVGTSTYGPPPGYLQGGPNSGYNWNSCCPNSCGSTSNNAACFAESITPPKGQPIQKAYKDFNTSWPLDSWQVTEPSAGYQTPYIRLLSKFTMLEENLTLLPNENISSTNSLLVFPNPSLNGSTLKVKWPDYTTQQIEILDLEGSIIASWKIEPNQKSIEISNEKLVPGMYIVLAKTNKGLLKSKITIQ
jgi:hypothetical protein